MQLLVAWFYWKTLEDESIANYFLNRTSIAQEIRPRIDEKHCTKSKDFAESGDIP
jgi:hypothetical protein